jgi:hypothetical protein
VPAELKMYILEIAVFLWTETSQRGVLVHKQIIVPSWLWVVPIGDDH